jgi:hypothetical protein
LIDALISLSLYIDGNDNARMTGDLMKMLMLTLSFIVRDLIAPEVLGAMYILVYKSTYFDILVCTGVWQLLYHLCHSSVLALSTMSIGQFIVRTPTGCTGSH